MVKYNDNKKSHVKVADKISKSPMFLKASFSNRESPYFYENLFFKPNWPVLTQWKISGAWLKSKPLSGSTEPRTVRTPTCVLFGLWWKILIFNFRMVWTLGRREGKKRNRLFWLILFWTSKCLCTNPTEKNNPKRISINSQFDM